MPSLVITFLGKDRPGLVGRLSDVVRAQHGNWLESRMTHLGGQFAGLVQVEIPQEHCSSLLDELKTLEADGLQVIAEIGSAPASPVAGQLFDLQVVGNDRQGIVREVTAVLGRHAVNVEDMVTECSEAPQGGGRVFRVTGRVCLPDGLSEGTLQADLELLATDLMIDLASASELPVGNEA